MDVTTLQDLRNHLETFISNQLNHFDRRLSKVEDLQQGSLNSKGERIRTEVQLESALDKLETRVSVLEKADRDWGNRFAQLWTTLGVSAILTIAAFLFELYRNTK